VAITGDTAERFFMLFFNFSFIFVTIPGWPHTRQQTDGFDYNIKITV
jgi:hypothetical protein